MTTNSETYTVTCAYTHCHRGRNYQRNVWEQPAGRGRPPKYCSEGCRQADYRNRKADREQRIAAAARMQQVEQVIRHAIAIEDPRLSQKRRDGLVVAIRRQLELAHIVS